MGALGCVAGICGRAFNAQGEGLNVYLVLLAPTGSGKESMASGLDRLMSVVESRAARDGRFCDIFSFKGPSRFGSGSALLRHLKEISPSCFSIMGEFGYQLKRLLGGTANDMSTREVMLDAYGKSGRGRTLVPTAYSKREDRMTPIKSPAWSLIGETTYETFRDSLTEQLITDGFLPRCTVVRIDERFPYPSDTFMNVKPRESLVESFSNLVELSHHCQQIIDGGGAGDSPATGGIVNVEFDQQAQQFLNGLMRARVDRMNVVTDSSQLETNLLSRHAVTTAKLASLFAIGAIKERSLSEPLVTEDIIKWANDFNLAGHQKVLNWIATGETGPTSGTNELFGRQINVVRNYILRFLDMDSDAVKLISHESDQDRLVVTHHRNWISRLNIFGEMIKHRMFKRCGYPPKSAIENIIASMLETGELELVTKDRFREVLISHGINRGGRFGTYYKVNRNRVRKNVDLEET